MTKSLCWNCGKEISESIEVNGELWCKDCAAPMFGKSSLKMTNKKIGNDFESDFCEMLFDNGFWAHNMACKSEGQPADIVAVRDGVGYLIDCKVCANNSFDTSRIEPNQHSAMTLWKEQGNDERWFALYLKLDDEIWMVSYDSFLRCDKKVFSDQLIRYYGLKFDEWVNL